MSSRAIVSECSAQVVLLVEDVPVLRPNLAISLRGTGFIVIEARTGEQALSLIRRHGGSIDWLVTNDTLRGGVSGAHVAFEFRYLNPRRPIVFITGDRLPRAIERMNDVVSLTWPFDDEVVPRLMTSLRDEVAHAPTLGL